MPYCYHICETPDSACEPDAEDLRASGLVDRNREIVETADRAHAQVFVDRFRQAGVKALPDGAGPDGRFVWEVHIRSENDLERVRTQNFWTRFRKLKTLSSELTFAQFTSSDSKKLLALQRALEVRFDTDFVAVDGHLGCSFKTMDAFMRSLRSGDRFWVSGRCLHIV